MQNSNNNVQKEYNKNYGNARKSKQNFNATTQIEFGGIFLLLDIILCIICLFLGHNIGILICNMKNVLFCFIFGIGASLVISWLDNYFGIDIKDIILNISVVALSKPYTLVLIITSVLTFIFNIRFNEKNILYFVILIFSITSYLKWKK